MLLIAFLSGLVVMLIYLIVVEFVKGSDRSKYKLKKHLMTLSGIQTHDKRLHLGLFNLKKISAIFKISSLPVLMLLMFIVGIVVLQNIYIFIFLCIAGTMIFFDVRRNITKRRKEKISFYMRDFMISVTNSMRAGSSLQNAIEKSVEDLKRLPDKNNENPLLDEVEKTVLDIQIGRSVDEALVAFKNRVNVEEADVFVNMTLKLKETGGDITEILTMVSGMVSERIIFKRDIMTLTAGKRYEAGILTIVPIALLVLLSLTAPTYIAPLFDTTLGRIMTMFGFFLILLNYYIGQRIVDIKI